MFALLSGSRFECACGSIECTATIPEPGTVPPADPRFVIHVVCNESALTPPANSTPNRADSTAKHANGTGVSADGVGKPADGTDKIAGGTAEFADGTAGTADGTAETAGGAADAVDGETDSSSGGVARGSNDDGVSDEDASGDAAGGRRPGLRYAREDGHRTAQTSEAVPVGFMDGYGIISAEHVRDIAARPDTVTHRVVPTNTPENADGTYTLPAHGTDPYRPSTALDEAVRCRDGYCADPGCAHSAWTADNDHVTEYDHHNPEAGGHTSYENLNTKCRYGHIQKTFGNWIDDQYRDPATGQLVTEYITPEGFVIPGDAETFEDTFPGLRRLRFTPPTTGDPPPRRIKPPETNPHHRTRAANKHARRRAERHRNRQRRLAREERRPLIVDDGGPPPF